MTQRKAIFGSVSIIQNMLSKYDSVSSTFTGKYLSCHVKKRNTSSDNISLWQNNRVVPHKNAFPPVSNSTRPVAPEQRAQRRHRGQKSGTLPCKWSLTWQASSHFPLAVGTISAVAKVAGNRLRTSVRWPRSSSVFPWKKAEWMSTSLPMPNKCQATARCWHNSIPGRLPYMYPLIAVTQRETQTEVRGKDKRNKCSCKPSFIHFVEGISELKWPVTQVI